MTIMTTIKSAIQARITPRAFWIALAVLAAAVLLIQVLMFDAAADSNPYSVSLSNPVAFPIDI